MNMANSELDINSKGYLVSKDKLVLVQIGTTLYALRSFETVTPDRLEELLDKHDIRLLKE